MIESNGLSAVAHRLARYHRSARHMASTNHDRLAAAVRRDLAQVTHIPGDISTAEIEARYQAALVVIRWRHAHDAA